MPETEMRFEFILATFFRKIISASFLKKSYVPFLNFGLFHFWEEAFFYIYKKKYGIFLKLGRFNLIKTILQFSRRHVVVKLDALHIYFIVLLKSLAFHRSTLWKRENYILHFSQYVCIHFFALLLQIEESKSGNFVTLKNASSLVFPTVNSAIIEFQKKEGKKLVKQSAFFCIIQKNQQSLNSNCHSRKQTSEKKIPLLHAVHAPRLLNIYYVYTTAIAWILHTFGYSIWFWKSCI